MYIPLVQTDYGSRIHFSCDSLRVIRPPFLNGCLGHSLIIMTAFSIMNDDFHGDAIKKENFNQDVQSYS